ncbi:TD and POZ domain-containing protein 5-like [Argiope bruennichi]|uniref:TD and POZ domain-containing protein 5-like n=1 Tax=Argiope bruennichi TaxID=94029 RepID=UPI0024940623|nr:TD and POZ domain-containing protein 5-like [Argiope bruennichi]
MSEVLPQDVLTVRCKMWNAGKATYSLVKEQYFAQTLLDVKSMYFIAVVKKFEDLIPGLQTIAHIKSASVEESTFSMNVCLSDDGNLHVIIPIEGNYIDLCHCKIFVLDTSGKWQKCSQDDIWRKYGEICEFVLSLKYETLMDKQSYLQKGTLTLKFEMIYTTEAEPQRTETIECGLHSPEILQKMPSDVKNPPAPKIKEINLKSPTTLIDDLVSLYMEGTLCDTKLRTETEAFPAHRAVLSARSPVFKKMFTIDMREKTRDSVDIPDLKADTVRKLLMFMYTDTVEDMDWETAKELYFAADKYEIVSLKNKCSSFLKLNIQPSNCCDILLLSDTHQDADLKRFVEDYVVARDQDVFGSKEWKIFMGNHLQLAADTMCLKYARK